MRRISVWIWTALMLAMTTMPAWAQSDGRRGTYGHGDWGWGHTIFGSVMMFLFMGGFILLIVLLVRWTGAGGGGRQQSSTPRTILDKRFAKGEIDKKEYEERKKTLSE